jgi:hypothetical protein
VEKHAAYCAMIRLGLNVPATWLLPHKKPPANERFPYTAARYNRPFDLEEVAARIGYPMFMKPYDGGAWVGVSPVADAGELHHNYDESGQRLMHLQGAVEGYDEFVRSLSVGAETMVMSYDPGRPLHDRYRIRHGFLSAEQGWEAVSIARLVNAFFGWEFNSCEALVKGATTHPIDYANACPDMALISLHYYFPWAITALAKWSIFCTVTGRRMEVDSHTRPYFDLGDREDLSYREKLDGYRRLADAHFDVERYQDFCAEHLADLDARMLEYVDGPEFDELLVATIRSAFPAHEHDQFVAHYRGLLAAWVADQRA